MWWACWQARGGRAGATAARRAPPRPPAARRGAGAPAAGVALVALAAATLPLVTRDSYYLDVATTILMNLTLTMSFRLQICTGQITMAHISFMAIGHYASALLVTRVGLSFRPDLCICLLLAAVLAVPIGSLALRVT